MNRETCYNAAMPRLEIAVTSLDDALQAQQGGADSIEISEDLSVGGLTPTFDLVRQIREAMTIQVNVIVRPHAHSFNYTPTDIDTILADTATLVQHQVDGIVFGALTPERHLDVELIKRVAQAAQHVPITIHRALDECANPEDALEALIGVAPRVLTSGPASTAWEGRDGLKRWIESFGSHFSFVAAGSLRADRLAEYDSYVQAHEYHFGSAARTDGKVDAHQVKHLRHILTP
ncbi:MAG: hypothetical protein CL610_05135 [Anaerolineaceae bacterium]|nr:hypothetical protein [Anaerolineaceae bacterium]